MRARFSLRALSLKCVLGGLGDNSADEEEQQSKRLDPHCGGEASSADL